MTYSIEFSKRAERQFNTLPQQIQKRLQLRIDALATNPHPRGAKKLEENENRYRIRVGDYRIIYEVQDVALVVILVRIGHRREVYR